MVRRNRPGCILAFAGLVLLASTSPVRAAAPFTCSNQAPVPPTVRADGYTELAGDLVIVCTGGAPTAAGNPIPQVNFTVFLNTNVTSRLTGSNGLSETLLLIDEPGAPGSSVQQQTACTTPLTGCTINGTGGATTPYAGTTGRPNIFQGILSGNQITFVGVPVDPPGNVGNLTLRITNIRTAAASLASGPGGAPATVQALISASGATSVPINNPTVIVAYSQSGLGFSVRDGANAAPLNVAVTLQQGRSQAPDGAPSAVLRFHETFPTAFKNRTTGNSPGPTNQNVPGQIYNTESGFTFAIGAVTAGLADSGTRLKATFAGVPAGARIFVGLHNLGNSSSQAVLNAGEADAFAPATASTTANGIEVVEVPIAAGSGTAVWEVVGGSPLAAENYDFPVFFTGSPTATGTAAVGGSLAPSPPSAFSASAGFSASAALPIPRFDGRSAAATDVLRVVEATPTLTSLNPSAGTAGSSVGVTLTGTNFVSGATLGISNATIKSLGVTFTSVVVVSPTTITATFVIADFASETVYINVTTPSGTSNAVPFAINPSNVPSLASIVPDSGSAGTSVDVTLTGTNFISGTTGANLAISNPKVTFTNGTTVSATSITATFVIAADAIGTANITVTTADGTSNPVVFTIVPATHPTALTISHIADGAGWSTAIILVNTDSVPASFTVQFTGDTGLPFAPSLVGLGNLSTVTGTIPVGGSQTISTDGTAVGLTEGWARVTSAQSVNGTAIFRLKQAAGSPVPFQEAAVPLLPDGDTTLLFPFDNNPGFATGFALAAPDNSVVTNITRRQRSQNGQDITTPQDAVNSANASGDCVALPAHGHCADVLKVDSASPQNLRGVAQFDSTGGRIFGLGIRASGAAFTSIEAVTRQTPAAKIITHIADGGTAASGRWRTTIILVNTDAFQASFTVNFWRDDGTPFVVQLVSGAAESTVSGVIPVGGSFTIETAGASTVTSTGWAEVLSNQGVGGTAIFRLESSGQEAAVPLLTRGGATLLLPFSVGAGFALGVALANSSTTQDAALTYTVRDESGQPLKDANGNPLTNIPVPWGDGTPDGSLPRHQHKSFVLNVPGIFAGEKRGVVEFDSVGGTIFGLGIRSNNGAFTSVRALEK
jgi:IPT/TIG domain